VAASVLDKGSFAHRRPCRAEDRGLVTALGRHVAAFDWDVMAPRSDEALAALVEALAPGRGIV